MIDGSAPTIGGFSLPELVRHAGKAARYEAFGIEALEVMVARDPHAVTRATLDEVIRGAEALVVIRTILLSFVGHEDDLLAIVEAAKVYNARSSAPVLVHVGAPA